MIKYITYDSFDDNGRNIVPVNSIYQMNKTASSNYAPEIMKIILHLKRKPDRYYVVVNALGSYEIWGSNRNGDAFPEVGLAHKSLRTDMGTPNDYGYKTFEYYAKFYKHHVNKDLKRSFGEIVFAHWNPILHRVELVIAIDTESGADIILALERGDQVAVSMGCRVKFDRCNICDNKAKTRTEYCKHAKNYLGKIITKDIANLWSKELNKVILPGAQVFVYNDFPRFFDLSKVHIGADRISYVLGKAASNGSVIYSVDIADAYGITDDMVDKFAQVNKKSEIEKDIGALGPDDIDGNMQTANKVTLLRKALDEKVNASIAAEPKLPRNLINTMSSALPLSTVLSTLLGLGIHPKPEEFQRMVLVRLKQQQLADELDNKGIIFNYKDDTEPQYLDISNNNFSNTLGRALVPYLQSRSCYPGFLEPRIESVMIIKTGQLEDEQEEYKPDPMHILAGLVALYAGLKLKANGYGPKQLAEIFSKPWLQSVIGGGSVAAIYNKINDKKNDEMFNHAIDYEDILQDTNFSGHIKQSGSREAAYGYGLLAGALALPGAYVANVYNQKSLQTKGHKLFPGAGINPRLAAGGAGLSTAGIAALIKNLPKKG